MPIGVFRSVITTVTASGVTDGVQRGESPLLTS